MFKVYNILKIGTALNEQIDFKGDRVWNTVVLTREEDGPD